MIRLLTLCAILLLHLVCVGQTTFNDSLLKEDYNVFKTIGSELSPKFNDADRAAFSAAFESRIGELTGKTMTVLEFVDFLSKSKAHSKLDGHGQIVLPEDLTSKLLNGGNALFPIPVLLLDTMMVVNAEGTALPYGAIITAMNGQSIETIIHTLIRDTSTASLRNLETSFDIFYLIKFGIPKTFEVTFKRSADAVEETATVAPVDVNTRNELHRKSVFPLHKDDLLHTINTNYYDATDAYYLQVNSFAGIDGNTSNVYNGYASEFKKIFKDISKQQPKNLIIDLRFNGGGDVQIPGLLYSYLAQNPFYESITMTIPDFNIPFKQYITAIGNTPITDSTEVNDFIKRHKNISKLVDGQYKFVLADEKKLTPQKLAFKGRVFVLIGGYTASASSYFTALFKADHRGILVGETIGGTHHDLTAGKIFDYTLPNTKIIVKMPIATVRFSERLETAVPEAFIQPEMQLDRDARYEYFMNKEDADLQLIFQRINETTP